MMKGLLGFSDDVWSLVVQLAGMVVSFFLGLMKSKRFPMKLAFGIGILVNIVGQMYIAGEGPGAVVGFVALPLACYLAAVVGRIMRRMGDGLRSMASSGEA